MKKLFILLILVSVVFVACKKKQDITEMKSENVEKSDVMKDQKIETVKSDELSDTMVDENALQNDEVKVDKIEQWNQQEILEDVYFGFDKSSLASESREVLVKHAQWLKEHDEIKVIIEGHCDERGTEQYNIALGDRRANAVKSYLISLGVNPANLRTQSLGELFPKVKDHTEWAWAQNRRAHFVLKKAN